MQLRTLTKASVGDIARTTGRSPEAVHYHVKALLKAGLAKEAFRRQVAKKPEIVYEPIGKKLQLPKAQDNPEIARLIRKSVTAGFRQSIRGYQAASKAAEKNPSHRQNIQVIKLIAQLKPADVKEFMKRIEAAVEFADKRRIESGVKLVWSSIVFPAELNIRGK